MKRVRRPRTKNDEIRTEYDFSGGTRGKYSKRYASGTNVVVLDPDVARLFPSARKVNAALRALAAKRQDRAPRHPR